MNKPVLITKKNHSMYGRLGYCIDFDTDKELYIVKVGNEVYTFAQFDFSWIGDKGITTEQLESVDFTTWVSKEQDTGYCAKCGKKLAKGKELTNARLGAMYLGWAYLCAECRAKL